MGMKAEQRFIDIKSAGVAIESRGEGQPEKIVGYAAVFYRSGDPGTEYRFNGFWDNFTERIMPTAFDETIRSDDVRGLYNHDMNMLLGRTASGTMKLSVDSVGLRYEITPPDTEIARSVVAAIKRGDLSGSSFSFIPEDVTFREIKNGDTTDVIREINRAKVFDVGPVVFPAYEATTTGVRAVSDLAEAKASYDAWKKQADGRAAFHRDLTRTQARVLEIQKGY